MKSNTTELSDLPKHEVLRALGQTTVQAGLFMIAVSTVLEHLGNLPESPLAQPFFTESTPVKYEQTNNTRGYFD